MNGLVQRGSQLLACLGRLGAGVQHDAQGGGQCRDLGCEIDDGGVGAHESVLEMSMNRAAGLARSAGCQAVNGLQCRAGGYCC
ncbi:hypothetical protein SDC9_212650 [bioreactor metagenome]|uniref:Uncharacterized protein n=1 Tax=bioreactor metagenome TaxID=1076179 RepID=A0A645JNK3_9ZZZZ